MHLSRIKRVGNQVRNLVRNRILLDLEENEYSDIGNDIDLMGACGYASWALWKVCPNTSLVLGSWRENSMVYTHAWIETRRHIIDVTATQFCLNFDPVRVVLKKGKAAVNYERESRDLEAEADILSWYNSGWTDDLVERLRQERLI